MERRDFLKLLVLTPIVASVDASTLWLPPSVMADEQLADALAPVYESVQSKADLYGWIVAHQMLADMEDWMPWLAESSSMFPSGKPLVLLADERSQPIGRNQDAFMARYGRHASYMQRYAWTGTATPNDGRHYRMAMTWNSKEQLLAQPTWMQQC